MQRARLQTLLLGAVVAALATMAATLPHTRPDDFPHTRLEESHPAADAVLTESPSRIVLVYSTPVQLGLSRVAVVGGRPPAGPAADGEAGEAPRASGADGAQQGAAVAVGELAHPSEDAEEALVLPLAEPLRSGDYRVDWTTAGPDGHPLSGSFGFRVELAANLPAGAASGGEARMDEGGADAGDDSGAGNAARIDQADAADLAAGGEAAGSGAQADEPTMSEVIPGQAVRFLFYVGVLALLGAVAFRGLVLPRAAAAGLNQEVLHAVHSPLWRIAAAGVALVVVSAPARLWMQANAFFPGEAGANLGAVLGWTPWGAGWWIQLGAALLAVVGLAMSRSPARASAGWTLAAVGALLLPVTALLSGHGFSDEPRQIAAAATYLHVCAASAWTGGVACLLFAGIPAAARHSDGDGTLAVAGRSDGTGAQRPPPTAASGTQPIVAMVGAFSRLARFAVVVLVLSGVAKAWAHLGAISDLWATPWGFGLLVKGGWVAVVMLLGLYNWKVVRPALAADPTPKRLRRSTWWEFALGVMVVWVTAYLVVQPL